MFVLVLGAALLFPSHSCYRIVAFAGIFLTSHTQLGCSPFGIINNKSIPRGIVVAGLAVVPAVHVVSAVGFVGFSLAMTYC